MASRMRAACGLQEEVRALQAMISEKDRKVPAYEAALDKLQRKYTGEGRGGVGAGAGPHVGDCCASAPASANHFVSGSSQFGPWQTAAPHKGRSSVRWVQGRQPIPRVPPTDYPLPSCLLPATTEALAQLDTERERSYRLGASHPIWRAVVVARARVACGLLHTRVRSAAHPPPPHPHQRPCVDEQPRVPLFQTTAHD
jgi:hypothetical protein